MVKISYEYFDGSTKRKPSMSPVFEGYIKATALRLKFEIGLVALHIVHVGTVGDRNHSPRSFHCTKPPRAIDVLKLYMTMKNSDKFMMDMRDLKQRATVADF